MRTSRLRICSALVMAMGMLVGCHAGDGRHAAPRIGDTQVGRTPTNTEIHFSLLLKFDDSGLNDYFNALNDRRSPLYRRFLTPAEIGQRFAAPVPVLRAIVRRLRRAGLAYVVAYPQRTALHVRASADVVARFFDTQYGHFVTSDGAAYDAPLRTARLPDDRLIRRWVVGVRGLDTKPTTEPASVAVSGLTPFLATTAYNIAPLHARGVDGAGKTIAIASYGRFSNADVRRFDERFGITGPFPEHVSVGGGTSEVHEETNLDVQVVRAVAPGARILVYEAPNDEGGESQMFAKIAADKRVKFVSVSWGTCDRPVSRKRRFDLERSFAVAAARGVNVFVASGNAGAYDCQRTNFADHRLTVDFPADSPSVIAVGGTVLRLRTDGTYLGESAWQDLLSNAGGGGGVNPVATRPRWQKELDLPEPDVERRGVPDVSAAASPGSAWLISHEGRWQRFGGTSAAAPLWASSMLLVQQWAERRNAGQFCFVAPILYDLANSTQEFPPFHDVTEGGNRHYRAGDGWDYATGLGSPDVWNLARAMVPHLKGRGVKRSCGKPHVK